MSDPHLPTVVMRSADTGISIAKQSLRRVDRETTVVPQPGRALNLSNGTLLRSHQETCHIHLGTLIGFQQVSDRVYFVCKSQQFRTPISTIDEAIKAYQTSLSELIQAEGGQAVAATEEEVDTMMNGYRFAEGAYDFLSCPLVLARSSILQLRGIVD